MKKTLVLICFLASIAPSYLGPLGHLLINGDKWLLALWPWLFFLTSYSVCFLLGTNWKQMKTKPYTIVIATLMAVLSWWGYLNIIFIPAGHLLLSACLILEQRLPLKSGN